MEYKVIPFVASIDLKKETTAHVAEQLQNLIKLYTDKGWEYVRLESVSTYVHPDNGCFGIGASPGYTTNNQMVVFQRK